MTRQYERCEHRRGSGLMGSKADHYGTPCPICEYEEDQKDKAFFIGCVVVAVVVIGLAAFVAGLLS